jgi:hypothetical protein
MHWVLGAIAVTWKKKTLESVIIRVLDPFNNQSYIEPTQQWYGEIGNDFFGLGVRFAPYDPDPNLKLQRGRRNCHCGVYTMALGLNCVLGTLQTMSTRLVVDAKDTNEIGVELRKLVAYDCFRDPPTLDATLLMSPKYQPQPITNTFRCHSWWRRMQHHELADCILSCCRKVANLIHCANYVMVVHFNQGTFRMHINHIKLNKCAAPHFTKAIHFS